MSILNWYFKNFLGIDRVESVDCFNCWFIMACFMFNFYQIHQCECVFIFFMINVSRRESIRLATRLFFWPKGVKMLVTTDRDLNFNVNVLININSNRLQGLYLIALWNFSQNLTHSYVTNLQKCTFNLKFNPTLYQSYNIL